MSGISNLPRLSPNIPKGEFCAPGVSGAKLARARAGHGWAMVADMHSHPMGRWRSPFGSFASGVTSKHIQLRNAEAEYRGISYAL